MIGIPRGMSVRNATDLNLGLGHRDSHIVENEAEILIHYRESLAAGVKEPFYTCGYCKTTLRSMGTENVLRWFTTHACTEEYAQPDPLYQLKAA